MPKKPKKVITLEYLESLVKIQEEKDKQKLKYPNNIGSI